MVPNVYSQIIQSSINGQCNSFSSGPNGFLVLNRNCDDPFTPGANVGLSIDDDDSNFYLHPATTLGIQRSYINLKFMNNQSSAIGNVVGEIESGSNGFRISSKNNDNRLEFESATDDIYFFTESYGNKTRFKFMHGWNINSGDNYIYSDSDDFGLQYNNGDYININGVGIGISRVATNYEFEVEGDMGITGTIYGLSDERMKKNIKSINSVLSSIMALNPVQFHYINHKEPAEDQDLNFGFLAQEIEKVFPNLVGEIEGLNENDDTKYKTVKYLDMIPLLVEAIQEQNHRIDKMEKDLETALLALRKLDTQ